MNVERAKWCDWHVITVDGTEDDPEITVMHPQCDFLVDVRSGEVQFNYVCQIQSEIDNAGFDTLLEQCRAPQYDHGQARWLNATNPGWFRARMRHFTIRGATWSEIDCEYEVEPIGVMGGCGDTQRTETK